MSNADVKFKTGSYNMERIELSQSSKVAKKIYESLSLKGVKPNLIVLSENDYKQLCNEANERIGKDVFKATRAMEFMAIDIIGSSFIEDEDIACYYK